MPRHRKILIVVAVLLFSVAWGLILIATATHGFEPKTSAQLAVMRNPRTNGCTIADMEVTLHKAYFANVDGRYYLRGAGTLHNNCANGIGVQVKLTGYDGSGTPVTTTDFFPAPANIPPGSYPFSLDYQLQYDPSIASFEIRPITLMDWHQ